MAGMFYSLKEAAGKLGISEEQIKELVGQGKLREFRDGANLLFKVSEVDSLVGDSSITAAAGGDEEIMLEPIEETQEQESADFDESLKPQEEAIETEEPLLTEEPELTEELQLSEESEPANEPELTEESLIEEQGALESSGSDEDIFGEDESIEQASKPAPEEPFSEDVSQEQFLEEPVSEIKSDEDISLSLEGVDDTGAGEDLTSADTQVPEEAVNVLGEEDTGLGELDDAMGGTAALELPGTGTGAEALEEIEGDVNLDTFGSGSGLLDLSLQADDTSLGGILDEIYTAPDQGQGAAQAEAPEAPVEIPDEAVAAEADMIADVGLAAQQPAAVMQGYVEPAPDASSGWFGMMLLLALVVVIYTAIVASSGLFNILPTILAQTRGIILYVLGGLLGFALILMIMAMMAGGSKGPKVKKEKKPKAPKVKKEKPKKEKKAKGK